MHALNALWPVLADAAASSADGTGIPLQQNEQSILGALFVALGAFTFYVATLISGQNLFRETNVTIATLVSAVIGGLLFLLSPASFLIVAPRLFKPQGGFADTNAFLELLLRFSWPYLAATIGAGLILGSVATLRARAAIWRWVQKGPGLRFPLRSYEPTWDSALRRMKSGGTVKVWLNDGRRFRGTLGNYSVGEEDRALLLDDCVELADRPFAPPLENGPAKTKVLFTAGAEIAGLEIPHASLKMHEDYLSHAAQSFFVSLTSLGLLFVGYAAWRTGSLLQDHRYEPLTGLYHALATVAVVLSALLLLYAAVLLRQDYVTFRSAVVLSPIATTSMLVVVLAGLTWAMAQLSSRGIDKTSVARGNVLAFALVAAAIALVAAAIALVWQQWDLIKGALRILLSPDAAERSRELAARFYEEFDLSADPGREYDRVRELLINEQGAGQFFDDLRRILDAVHAFEPVHLLAIFLGQLRSGRLRPPTRVNPA